MQQAIASQEIWLGVPSWIGNSPNLLATYPIPLDLGRHTAPELSQIGKDFLNSSQVQFKGNPWLGVKRERYGLSVVVKLPIRRAHASISTTLFPTHSEFRRSQLRPMIRELNEFTQAGHIASFQRFVRKLIQQAVTAASLPE